MQYVTRHPASTLNIDFFSRQGDESIGSFAGFPSTDRFSGACCASMHILAHTPSIAFRHLPPQSHTHSEHRFPAPSSTVTHTHTEHRFPAPSSTVTHTHRASLSGTFLHSHTHTPSIAFRHLPPQSHTHTHRASLSGTFLHSHSH